MVYIYICIFIYLIQKLLCSGQSALKVIFEKFCVQLSAQRALFLLKVQIFFTAWSKYLDAGIIRKCNVTNSFHILSSSFFTNHRTVRCYRLRCSQPPQINHKPNNCALKRVITLREDSDCVQRFSL
jgi:hypothetical protein